MGSDRRLKIVLVTTVPDTLASILIGQPNYLAKHFDVSLVTSPGSLVERVEQNEGLSVRTVPMERGINPFKDLISIWHMWRTLHRLRPDIVHSYTPKAGLVTMVSAWLCGVPVRVHTFTGLIFPTATGVKQKILIWVDRLICACATHVVPEGLGVQHDLESYRITGKPLKVIGHGNIAGVDTEHFSPEAVGVRAAAAELRARLKLEPQAMVFCFVGRLNKDKGVVELCAAFDALPEQAHLLLAGGLDHSAPISDDLQKKIKNHPRIHALGFMEDIRPALHLANVLVLPSYREGFPNVVLQAGSMALPVISTDINGCNEIIEPGFNGWLVPPRDAKALMVAMQEAMQTPSSSRKEMGTSARSRVQQWFEQRQHWERMKLFYQGLLSDR
ncbi:glycosyltransferase family 4 protein [Comamonas resistens]|uniref:glycosyltransferase family 4 protein n=1 Tax=Comamonas resistens TaxID=3046670 RepID=UPI0039BD13CB